MVIGITGTGQSLAHLSAVLAGTDWEMRLRSIEIVILAFVLVLTRYRQANR